MKNILLRCAACLVVLVLIASACGPAQTPTTAPTEAAGATPGTTRPAGFDPDVLYIAHIQDPPTVDAHLATSYAEQYTHNSYDRLIEADTVTGELVGVLAESWELSSDGLTYVLHLREGVKFHDGTDFDAEAVKLNFERLAALNAWMTSAWEFIDTIEVVDDHTLEVTLTKPLALWPNFLVSNPKIVCPSAIKQHEVDGDWGQAYLAEHVCGTGAYTLEAWEKGRELHLAKFDDYWRGWDGKHVSEVHQLIIPEPSTQRMMLEAGDLDVALLYNDDFIPAWEANPDIKLVTERSPEQFYCRLNTNGGPTADKNVRLALNYLFDVEQFEDLNALPQPRSDGPVPMVLFPGRDTPPEIPYNTFDLEKAREYLAQSDYPDGFTMSVIGDAEEARDKTFVQVLQAQAAELGIQVEIISEAWSYTISRGDCKECQSNPDDPMFVNAFVLRTPPLYADPSAFLERMYLTKDHGGVRNFLWYDDPEVTDLILQGMALPDREAAMDLYWEADLKIIDDVPDIFIDQFHVVSPMRQWVQGYTPDAMQSWTWNYYHIWKE